MLGDLPYTSFFAETVAAAAYNEHDDSVNRWAASRSMGSAHYELQTQTSIQRRRRTESSILWWPTCSWGIVDRQQ